MAVIVYTALIIIVVIYIDDVLIQQMPEYDSFLYDFDFYY